MLQHWISRSGEDRAYNKPATCMVAHGTESQACPRQQFTAKGLAKGNMHTLRVCNYSYGNMGSYHRAL